jgi:hypothetical protein
VPHGSAVLLPYGCLRGSDSRCIDLIPSQAKSCTSGLRRSRRQDARLRRFARSRPLTSVRSSACSRSPWGSRCVWDRIADSRASRPVGAADSYRLTMMGEGEKHEPGVQLGGRAAGTFQGRRLAEAVERMDSERRSGASRAAFGRWRLSPELATSAAGPMFF